MVRYILVEDWLRERSSKSNIKNKINAEGGYREEELRVCYWVTRPKELELGKAWQRGRFGVGWRVVMCFLLAG